LVLGSLVATIEAVLDHPRLVSLVFAGAPHAVWAGLAADGRPIQYAHLPEALELWDVWTPFAGVPAAFEPPSASFALDWSQLQRMRARGIRFATITHAAGISSTGDERLDARLPFPEPYRIPPNVAATIRKTHRAGGRIVAIGTTVVRALEHAAVGRGLVFGGDGVADQRIGPRTKLRIVDAILSGTHEPGTSHYELLRAFASDDALRDASLELDRTGYRTHEFGDSVFLTMVRQAHHERKNRKLTAEAAESAE
jgi:S-adenosylmethionine:tRNA ribosyltransferase-isomerase